jgi:hypothetical protein
MILRMPLCLVCNTATVVGWLGETTSSLTCRGPVLTFKFHQIAIQQHTYCHEAAVSTNNAAEGGIRSRCHHYPQDVNPGCAKAG